MRKVLVLGLLLLLHFSNSECQFSHASKGVLDLRNIPEPDNFIVKLNGEWEFYWMKMLRPYDFESGSVVPDYYGKVPSYWTDYPDIKTHKFGYATYRLKVLVPEGKIPPLAIDLPTFDTSYDLYINGKYIGGNGITGRSAEESKPEYSRVFARIVPESDTLDIVVNVSNYFHRRGGFWLPARFGTFPIVQRRLANSWAFDWAVISLLAGFSILFLFFYFFSGRQTIMICFSILTMGLISRPMFTSNYQVNSFFNVSWDWIVKFEYLGLVMIIISLSWFARFLYPTRFSRITALIMTYIFSAVLFLVLIFPVTVFSYSIMLFYPAILLQMIYLIIRSYRGAFKGITTEIIYALAFTGLLAGGLYDIIISMGRSIGGGEYIISSFVVVFVFIQAILVLYKWVLASDEREKLKNELEFMNRNLENLIKDRTSELRRQNEEIELQNSRIALQNKQLTDTIQLRNRILSVIAHDLRSPVVNILYLLNLLKEKEFKEKYDEFASSSIDYAQRVINLLENMLVWGLGQEDKIKYSPAMHDLADIILTNLSIFKETADKKEITVNFTQVGNSIAWCDKDLLDIIIRNLLSNAVKYTPRNGRISIFLKDKKHNGEGIMLKISDNGEGISEEKQKLIFTSETIQSTPGTENEKGTGLGLKLCHELVLLNEGKMAVESKPGEGTSFIISLPAMEPGRS
ncbi:MAG TPA: sensor histidine kinase [Bacteroidales bacterium]|nr:sensor histidine kinase [Bacteroidales bacterium]